MNGSHIANRLFTSSRFFIAVVLALLITYFYITYEGVTIQDWMEYTKWVFGIYASSEGVKHGAHAFKEKGTHE